MRIVLNEDSRNQLIAKSKNSNPKGLQRYKRRVKSRISSSNRDYNKLDMNKLFKEDILDINIPVKGETDNYTVSISFAGLLDSLHNVLKDRTDIQLRDLVKAMLDAFNKNDVYVRCTCPDFFYRFGYYATVNNIITGQPQLIPSKITNPNDTLGSACKHVLLVLSNSGWIIKVASVITNYINYMHKNRESLYASVIYPAIYNKKYEKEVQTSFFDDEELETDSDTIDISNKEARTKTQFKPGNPTRFKAQDTVKNQLSIEDEE